MCKGLFEVLKIDVALEANGVLDRSDPRLLWDLGVCGVLSEEPKLIGTLDTECTFDVTGTVWTG